MKCPAILQVFRWLTGLETSVSGPDLMEQVGFSLH
jgi:hypothetical protein